MRTPYLLFTMSPPPEAPAEPEPSWQRLRDHPAVVEQRERDGHGERISSLTAHGGLLVAGIGDWGANSGPVGVAAWDVSTLDPDTSGPASIPTEAVDVWRVVGGRLCGPWTDPSAGWRVPAGITRQDACGRWGVLSLPPMVHVLDVDALGGMLAVCGSGYTANNPGTVVAVVHVSHDAGRTWTVGRETLTGANTVGGRYVWLRAFNGRLWAGGPEGVESSADGTTWTAHPDAPISMRARAVHATAEALHGPGWTWDGTTATDVPGTPQGTCEGDPVTMRGNVAQWRGETVTLPPLTTAAARTPDGRWWAGTATGALYVLGQE